MCQLVDTGITAVVKARCCYSLLHNIVTVLDQRQDLERDESRGASKKKKAETRGIMEGNAPHVLVVAEILMMPKETVDRRCMKAEILPLEIQKSLLNEIGRVSALTLKLQLYSIIDKVVSLTLHVPCVQGPDAETIKIASDLNQMTHTVSEK